MDVQGAATPHLHAPRAVHGFCLILAQDSRRHSFRPFGSFPSNRRIYVVLRRGQVGLKSSATLAKELVPRGTFPAFQVAWQPAKQASFVCWRSWKLFDVVVEMTFKRVSSGRAGRVQL